jgi:hypothetical protein
MTNPNTQCLRRLCSVHHRSGFCGAVCSYPTFGLRKGMPRIASTLILPWITLGPHFRGLNNFRRGTFRRLYLNVGFAGGGFRLLRSSPSPAKSDGHHLVDLATQLSWAVRSISTGDQRSLVQQLNGPLGFGTFRLVFASSLQLCLL